jgi:hypothetical protein
MHRLPEHLRRSPGRPPRSTWTAVRPRRPSARRPRTGPPRRPDVAPPRTAITLNYGRWELHPPALVPRPGRGSGGGPPSPGILAPWLARAAVVQVRHAAPESSAMGRPGSSAAESSCRRRRHHPAVEFGRLPRSRLTGTPARRRPAGHRGWRVRDAPSARAASLASSAALLTHRATPLPGPTSGRRPLRHSPRQPLRHSLRVGGAYPWLRWPSASVLVSPPSWG